MFSKVSLEPVGFESTLDPVKEIKDTDVQTSEVLKTSRADESTSHNSVELQTDNVASEQKKQKANYDEAKLAGFLSRICPAVISELEKAAKSKAFSNYKTARDESQDSTKLLHTLDCRHLIDIEKVRVSSVSWSCTGNVIAVGFEATKHDSWCLHDGAVHFYHINQYKFDGKSPDKSVVTKSCVTSVAMHPYEPSIIAVGTQTGEVSVWLLNAREPALQFSNEVNHKDRVTKLSWVTVNQQLLLFSSSLDGHIFSYRVTPGINSVVLADRYMINEVESALQPGVTCFSFSIQSGLFVAALEGGQLLHCSTLGAASSTYERPSSAASFKRPVLKTLGKDFGLVVSLEFSPYVDHLFISAHMDDVFLVRSINEVAPLHIIHTDFDSVLGCTWSQSQGNIALVWGLQSTNAAQSPSIHAYNTDSGKLAATFQPEIESGSLTGSVYSAAVSHKSPKLVAVGCTDGRAYVWNAPHFFRE